MYEDIGVIKMRMTISSDLMENYRIGCTHTLNGEKYEVVEYNFVWHTPKFCQAEITFFKVYNKTPEQIIAAERVTHYRTKLEQAKADMEYWEKKQ